ncbi:MULTISPECIES: ABC transporter substrate-binding protein [unclassified Actinomadura]|uniref:ABC transporter substrate-binding protein n=1 Tax=unclassified Actinomadura TaxID=2626254 RepID=UPI0011ECD4B4|nr:ABC transporter substrate-binding protein [Actinomadura sp. K4S16]
MRSALGGHRARPRTRGGAPARALAATITAGALLLTGACGGSSASGDEDITLSVGLFGDFGFEPLYRQFEQAHPNVRIKERQATYDDHHTNLAAHIATGSGAADVEAIEVGYIGTYTAQPQRFVDLRKYGASSRQSEYLSWKWQQGVAANGAVIGLGTDVGGLALCYRRDLFAKAGLPADREKVSALWPNWQAFLATGRRFAAKAPSGVKFVDGPGEFFRAMVAQAPEGVYDRQDKVVAATNPAVKQAWDLSTQMVSDGLSAKLTSFTPAWDTGFAKSSFATVACPAWMMAYIQEHSPGSSGRWDIAAIPGGGGSAGGTHLTVPTQSKHQKEAAELVQFLSAAPQQEAVFKAIGNFPSLPALYDKPEVRDYTNPFFNGAPVGKIYADSAKSLDPQHLGPAEGQVRAAIGNGLTRVDQGKQSPDQAWKQALDDVSKVK